MKPNSQNKETPVVFESQGYQLVGVLHEPQKQTHTAVVMCHGFTGNKIESRRLFVDAARAFCRSGYTALRFDFFGSGDSAGDFADSLISYNIQNLKDAIDWSRGRGYKQIAVLGISMGAATAILTLSGYPTDALIAWSTVPDMKKLFNSIDPKFGETKDRLQNYEFDGWLLKNAFWLDAVKYDIQSALRKLEMPKLIVQGSADQPIFVEGFEDFKMIVQPPCDFMMIPGAGHTYERVRFRTQVIRNTLIWLQRHLPIK